MRKSTLFLLLFILCALLVSCTAGGNSAWVRQVLGTDTAIYRSEQTLSTLDTEGETAHALCETLEWFLSGSIQLKEFQNGKQGLRLYRDEILNNLMRQNYSAYVGNPTLSAAVSQAYPHITASILIPKEDFEAAASHCLGLSSVSNGNGTNFSYLSRAACYIPPLQARPLTVHTSVLSLEETEHTYRLSFSLEDTEGQSALYSAMFVKRADGSPYLKSLTAI
jgi:hypothetical protein